MAQIEYHFSAPGCGSGPGENRKPGENPGRYRHCMREGFAHDESRSLGKPEKAVRKPVKRKPGDLLKWNYAPAPGRWGGALCFARGKTAAAV